MQTDSTCILHPCSNEIYRDSVLCKQHYTERLMTIKTIFTIHNQPNKLTIEELAATITEREIFGDVLEEIENTHYTTKYNPFSNRRNIQYIKKRTRFRAVL